MNLLGIGNNYKTQVKANWRDFNNRNYTRRCSLSQNNKPKGGLNNDKKRLCKNCKSNK